MLATVETNTTLSINSTPIKNECPEQGHGIIIVFPFEKKKKKETRMLTMSQGWGTLDSKVVPVNVLR